jgi:hypothetical protein
MSPAEVNIPAAFCDRLPGLKGFWTGYWPEMLESKTEETWPQAGILAYKAEYLRANRLWLFASKTLSIFDRRTASLLATWIQRLFQLWRQAESHLLLKTATLPGVGSGDGTGVATRRNCNSIHVGVAIIETVMH